MTGRTPLAFVAAFSVGRAVVAGAGRGPRTAELLLALVTPLGASDLDVELVRRLQGRVRNELGRSEVGVGRRGVRLRPVGVTSRGPATLERSANTNVRNHRVGKGRTRRW